MSRADYLTFLAGATAALGLLFVAGSMLMPKVWFASFGFGVVALFYIPVTSAGCRRLRDAGEDPWRMLNPLKPALATLIGLWLLSLLLRTPIGFAAFYLSALVAAPLYAFAAALVSLGVFVVTAIYFSDTGARLLLPSTP
jgi:uncharacterized membrane protein YhaH (DUF805 family)